MRLVNVSVVIFATICVSIALSTAPRPRHRWGVRPASRVTQLLQATTVFTDDLCEARRRAVSEERENLLSKFYNALRVRWWLEAEKTDEQVMKTLKLTGRSGDELTGHHNFKTFAKFANKAEKYKLGEWYRSRVSTYDAWVKLGLEDVPLELVHKAPGYLTYNRYVNMFDKYALIAMKNGNRPPVLVSPNASPKEMSSRMLIWAATERSDDYVRAALGIRVKSGEALLTTHPGYNYYNQYRGYVEEAQKMKTATTAA